MRAPPCRSDATPWVPCAGLLAALSIACATACGTPDILRSQAPPLSEGNRALYARINLEKARALYAEGRIDMAESAARRGLRFEPDDTDLLRLRAELLEELGRADEARVLRARADEIEPPLPPPSDAPHPLSTPRNRVLLVLLPPSPSLLDRTDRGRVPRDWPRGVAAATLEERLRVRLPHARVVTLTDGPHPSSNSVPASQAWLAAEQADAVVSIRVDRAFCGSSVKDGDFAVAWLRVAAARPDLADPEARLIRVALDTPPDHGCEAAAVAHALERVLELRAVHEALQAPRSPRGTPWANASIRTLFPRIAWRAQEEVAQGRRYLSVGELDLALRHFRRAQRIDPDDPTIVAFVEDVSKSLDLARLLEPVTGHTQAEAEAARSLGAQLSDSQRRGLEAQLAHEQRRRQDMLSALSVLKESRQAPGPGALAAMRPVELVDPTATGIALAMERLPAGQALEVRSLYAPDGSVLARYYFPEDERTPVLREEDSNGDSEPDRWVGYDDKGVVSEVWEAQDPGGPPTLHLVYAPGGNPIERVELDHDGDGRLDRLFVYTGGLLREESWDTDGDGAFDRFQRFDETGSLTMREEDVDGDEEIDVRTAYNKGRIVRREILNAELLSEIQ